MPSIIMSDFEVGIINADHREIRDKKVRCCLFHLGQNVYRRAQEEGFQRKYANPNDSSIRDTARMLFALAVLPSEDIEDRFKELEDEIPEDFEEFYHYFGRTYVTG